MKNCLKCSSDKIIPYARVLDTGHYAMGYLQVAFDGDPDALFFKERTMCEADVSVCGSCGYLEFYATSPETLYESYQESLKKNVEGEENL